MKRKIKGKETAVALRYDMNEFIAPKIVGKGQGEVAKRIIEKARENDIPVYQDEKLAGQLSEMEIDSFIPEELYEAVAQILAFIAGVDADEIQ